MLASWLTLAWLTQAIVVAGIFNAWDRNMWFHTGYWMDTRPTLLEPVFFALTACTALLPLLGPAIVAMICSMSKDDYVGFSLNFSNKR